MTEIRDIIKTIITVTAVTATFTAADKRHGNGWNRIVSGFPPLPN